MAWAAGHQEAVSVLYCVGMAECRGLCLGDKNRARFKEWKIRGLELVFSIDIGLLPPCLPALYALLLLQIRGDKDLEDAKRLQQEYGYGYGNPSDRAMQIADTTSKPTPMLPFPKSDI